MTKKDVVKSQAKKDKTHKVKAKYGYFQGLVLCFYKRDFFVDVIERWKGSGALFLLLLCILVMMPFALFQAGHIQRYYDDIVLPNISKFPDVAVNQGVASLNKPMPFVIKDDKTKQPVIVIDTTGKVKKLSGKPPYNNVFLLVTKNEYTLKLADATALVTQLPLSGQGVLKAQGFKVALEEVKSAVFMTLYPSLVTSIFVAELLVIFVFSMLAGIFSRIIFKQALTFMQSFRLSCIVAAPQLIVAVLTLAYKVNQTITGLTLFCLYFGYYSYAVLAYKYRKKDLVKR